MGWALKSGATEVGEIGVSYAGLSKSFLVLFIWTQKVKASYLLLYPDRTMQTRSDDLIKEVINGFDEAWMRR